MDILLWSGMPVWAELSCIVMGVALGGLGGFWAGELHEKRKTETRFTDMIQRRRHDLADRGRTTERRPQHDGQQPSRNAKIVVTSRRAPRPDHRSDQLF